MRRRADLVSVSYNFPLLGSRPFLRSSWIPVHRPPHNIFTINPSFQLALADLSYLYPKNTNQQKLSTTMYCQGNCVNGSWYQQMEKL
jgi:hypothetical protein